MIRGQSGGSSMLGEIYYFEGDTPLGPWAYGRKIITHSRTGRGADGRSVRETYSFYNPMQHPEFDRAGGREIFLEGTFTTAFADAVAPRIPAYDYNQIMYKLHLDDARLFLPVPVYRAPGDPPSYRTRDALLEHGLGEVAFFAPDRPRAGTLPVREVQPDARAGPRLVAGAQEQEGPTRFHCAPSGDAPPGTVPLYEQVDGRGRFTYTTAPASGAATIVCNVWPAPVRLPVRYYDTLRIEIPQEPSRMTGIVSYGAYVPPTRLALSRDRRAARPRTAAPSAPSPGTTRTP